jgi:hypothetical protein
MQEQRGRTTGGNKGFTDMAIWTTGGQGTTYQPIPAPKELPSEGRKRISKRWALRLGFGGAGLVVVVVAIVLVLIFTAGAKPLPIGATATIDYPSGPVMVAVTKAATTADIVGYWLTAGPGIAFVIVPVSLTNEGGELSLPSKDFEIHTTQGGVYRLDTQATAAYSAEEFNALADLRLAAGEEKKGFLIFQVPMRELTGASLVAGATRADPPKLDLSL